MFQINARVDVHHSQNWSVGPIISVLLLCHGHKNFFVAIKKLEGCDFQLRGVSAYPFILDPWLEVSADQNRSKFVIYMDELLGMLVQSVTSGDDEISVVLSSDGQETGSLLLCGITKMVI